ncbi:MAG: C4-type zinc ribbon domain-containing protein [Bacteroidales bacterium]
MKEKISEKKTSEKKTTAQKTTLEEHDLGIEQKMISLFALQQIDSNIDRIRTLRGELPLEVQDLEDDVAGYQTKIEKLNEEVAEINLNITNRKSSITELKTQIKKYEKQQKEVKNNREYDALTKEVEYQSLEIQLHEKRIKEAGIQLEHKTEELEKVSHACEERQKDLDLKKKELDEIIAETEKEEKALLKKSEEYQSHVDARWLHTYERIRNNARNGLAVVCIERDACGGCFSKIPPQRQIEIRMHKKMTACEYCGRFLVDEDIKEKASDL